MLPYSIVTHILSLIHYPVLKRHLTQFLFTSRLAVAATDVTGRAFWANRMLELPLPNMNTNACASMTCPLQPNVAQTYRYVLPVSRGFPTVKYMHIKKNEIKFISRLVDHYY
jgi:hypothetical protein